MVSDLGHRHPSRARGAFRESEVVDHRRPSRHGDHDAGRQMDRRRPAVGCRGAGDGEPRLASRRCRLAFVASRSRTCAPPRRRRGCLLAGAERQRGSRRPPRHARVALDRRCRPRHRHGSPGSAGGGLRHPAPSTRCPTPCGTHRRRGAATRRPGRNRPRRTVRHRRRSDGRCVVRGENVVVATRPCLARGRPLRKGAGETATACLGCHVAKR